MAVKVYEEEKIRAIAEKIRECAGTEKTYTTAEMPNGVEEVYNAGIEKGEASSDGYLRYSSVVKINHYNLFGRKNVVLNVPLVTDYNTAFRQNSVNTTVEHLTINGSLDGTITNASMAFYSPVNETTLKTLTLNCDFSKCTAFTFFAIYLSTLEVIDGKPIDFSSATTIGAWHNCPLGSSLREMRVVPNSIKVNIQFPSDDKLSDETIQSIIDGLITITDGVARTLSLHAKVKEKLTDEQKATITITKGWTLA